MLLDERVMDLCCAVQHLGHQVEAAKMLLVLNLETFLRGKKHAIDHGDAIGDVFADEIEVAAKGFGAVGTA